MKRTSRLAVARVHVEAQGSVLKQPLTTSWSDGNRIQVEASTDHSESGGTIVIGTEVAYYSGVEVAESDDPSAPDYLLGVQRPNPQNHAAGTFIQEGLSANVVKLVDGYPDGEEVTIPDIPTSSLAYGFLRNGSYERETAPVVPLEIDDEGDALVTEGPLGAVPEFDFDGEVIAPGPIVGIIEETTPGIIDTNVPPLIEEIVTPIGLGDGEVPDNPLAAPTVIQTVKTNVVDMRPYTIPVDWVAFEVQRSTNGTDWNSLGQSGSLYVDTDISYGTTYYYRYRVLDSEGNASDWSPASTGYQPSQAGTADLAVRSVTADVLASIVTLSSLFRTAGSGARVEFDSNGIRLYNSGGTVTANLNPSTGVATLIGSIYRSSLSESGARVEIDSNGLRLYDSGGTATAQLSTSTGVASLFGAIYRSSVGASGSRVEIDSNGLRFYDASSNVKLHLNASTGGAAFTGDISGASGTFTGNLSGSTITTSSFASSSGSPRGSTTIVRIASGAITFDMTADARIYSAVESSILASLILEADRIRLEAPLYGGGTGDAVQVATQLNLQGGIRWQDSSLTDNSPSVSQGGATQIPGTTSNPQTWLKVITPTNATRWIPVYG